jgi:hypothetical protein
MDNAIDIPGFVALYIFMLAAFAGWVIIGRVPAILHTPLMSGSNFVHGIVVVGGVYALLGASTVQEQVDRLRRRAARRGQRRRRLRRHRPHAGHVPDAGRQAGPAQPLGARQAPCTRRSTEDAAMSIAPN